MTTIVLVRKNNEVVVAGDGQVSMGNTVVKSTASKVRKIEKRDVVAGFAGSTADALTLFERLEGKLEKHAGNLSRAAVELAKDWRTDKYLRRLEALMAVGDKNNSYIISGTGDVLEPEGDVIGIGSGGNYALAAGKVLMEGNMSAEEVAKKAIKVAADICVFTNDNVKASAVDPANPATTSLFSIFLTFEAVLFTTVFPILTCPSPATTTSLFFLTSTIVVILNKW